MPGYAAGAYAGMAYSSVGAVTGTGESRPIPSAATTPKVIDGDYVLTDDGMLLEGDAALEEVLFLLGTIDGTFIAPDGTKRGSTVVQIRTFTDQSLVEVRDRVIRALKPATDRGSIKNVVVTPNPYMHDQSTAVLDYLVTFEPTGLV